MQRMSEHVATTRIERRFRERSNGDFSALRTGPIAGWTAFGADGLIDTFANYEAGRSRSKLVGLDDGLTASMLGDFRQDVPWNYNDDLDF